MHRKITLTYFYAISVAAHIGGTLLYLGFLSKEPETKLQIGGAYKPLQITLARTKQDTVNTNTKVTQSLPQTSAESPETARKKGFVDAPPPRAYSARLGSKGEVEPAKIIKHIDTSPVSQKQDTHRNNKDFNFTPRTLNALHNGIKIQHYNMPPTQALQAHNAAIQDKLKHYLNKHFYYPRIAVRKGWQGTVELGLRVESSGKLTRIRVTKTSGYSILDEAALATLKKADYIKGIETSLTSGYFDTTLPVRYQLIGG